MELSLTDHLLEQVRSLVVQGYRLSEVVEVWQAVEQDLSERRDMEDWLRAFISKLDP